MRHKKGFANLLSLTVLVGGGLLLAGCNTEAGEDGADGRDGQDAVGETVIHTTTSGFAINNEAILVAPEAEDGDDITDAFSEALFNVPDHAVVVLPKGRFAVNQTIAINSASGLTITGHGIHETILDFSGSAGDDAIRFTGGNSITIRDLGVYEAPKNGIKATNVNGIQMAYTATVWEGDLEANNGAYGLYPLQSQNVLLEHNFAFGSADAGIYVGQSENIVVRDNVAKQNVAGIEIENSTMADVYNNIAIDNAAGILIFDLPGLNKAFGGNVRIFNNQSISNNSENVGAGVVGLAPSGTGVLVLATSDVEIYANQITDNDTTAVAMSSYLLVDDDLAGYPSNFGDTLADGWSPTLKNVSVHSNTIARNGADPQGDLIASIAAGYGSANNSKGEAQTFPAILYDGAGELFSNLGQLDGFNALLSDDAESAGVSYGAYEAGDLICANRNINANPAPDYEEVNTGLVYPVNPADVTIVDGGGVPQPHLLIDQMVNNTYLNCVQPRLEPAVVNFRNTFYGCTGDDLAEAACAL